MIGAGPGHPSTVGRYALFGEIASGGMATVYLGRLLGTAGFTRTVAVKRLHPPFARDPRFAERFVQEAQLAAAVRHPNVVPTLDVVAEAGELFLVMEYVGGETLARLGRSARRIPTDIAAAIVAGALYGLHAAHEALDAAQRPLGIVHRDVSPQNILVGTDGVARVLDFGIAKATTTASITQEGQLRGKLRYMSPEQCRGAVLDRRADIFAAGIVLWESLTGRALFDGDDAAVIIRQVLEATIPAPSELARGVPPALDAVAMRALERDPDRRFQTAWDMAVALEEAQPPAPPRRVGELVASTAAAGISTRTSLLLELESMPDAELERRFSGRTEDATLPTLIPVGEADRSPPPSVTPAATASWRRSLAVVPALIALLTAGWVGLSRAGGTSHAGVALHVPFGAPELGAPSVPSPAVSPVASDAAPTPNATAASQAPPGVRFAPRPRAASSQKPALPSAPDCSPPYTIDARGDKHYKRECL